MAERVEVGQIDVPSGVLMLLDPGMIRYWRHGGDPRSPLRDAGAEVDVAITGADALEAARGYGQPFGPPYLFDVPVDDVRPSCARFDEFAAGRGLDARAEPLERRVSHLERTRLVTGDGTGAAATPGVGVVPFNRLWAVAAGGVAVDRPVSVVGTRASGGDVAGRWTKIELVIDPGAPVARTGWVDGVRVERGLLLCCDLGALAEFHVWASDDGLGDLDFWGADSEALAERVGASRMESRPEARIFGWRDLPMDDVRDRSRRLRDLSARDGLRTVVSSKPHNPFHRLEAEIGAGGTRAGGISLSGTRALGFNDLAFRWGDGVAAVRPGYGPDGSLVRIGIALHGPDRSPPQTGSG